MYKVKIDDKICNLEFMTTAESAESGTKPVEFDPTAWGSVVKSLNIPDDIPCRETASFEDFTEEIKRFLNTDDVYVNYDNILGQLTIECELQFIHVWSQKTNEGESNELG